MVMLARAAHLDRMCCIANQRHDVRARGELRDLQVRSAPDRLDDDTTARCAAHQNRPRDRRESWVVDGTLIPTRDPRRAARSKNDRWSCNAQVVVRRRDLRIVAITAGGPGNRNFRAGIEGVISFLKRCFGWDRCAWRSYESFRAYTWGSVIAANLVMLARHAMS